MFHGEHGDNVMRTVKLWQVREFSKDAAMGLSKPLGRRLRSPERATAIVRYLRLKGREVFAVPFKIYK